MVHNDFEISDTCESDCTAIKVFVNKTNLTFLTFLHKISIEWELNSQLNITGLQV